VCTRYLKYTLFQTISDDSEEDAPAGIDSIESQISDYDSEKSVLKFKTWVGAKLGTTILHYFIFYTLPGYYYMASVTSGEMADCDWLRSTFSGPLFSRIWRSIA
jgi:hypothetical protein